jgi:hypothetical protein
MTTAQINPYPDIAPPVGADAPFEWEADEVLYPAYRIVYGPERAIGTDRQKAEVQTSAVQLADGSIHTTDDAPRINVGIYTDDGLNVDEARQLAVLLVEAADILDGGLDDHHHDGQSASRGHTPGGHCTHDDHTTHSRTTPTTAPAAHHPYRSAAFQHG